MRDGTWKGNILGMRAALAGMLLLTAALAGCGDEGEQNRRMSAPEVTVRTIVPRQVSFSTELAGRVAAFQISEVRPQVNGIIQKRLFEEGADVKAGDVLYQIDPALYRAAYDSARAALARAEANVEPARLKTRRFKNLVRTNAVSRQDNEDADAAHKQAVADVGVCRAAVEEARIRLEYTNVTAPITGRISQSLVTPGALVTANQAAALTTVQQIDPVYVDVTQSSAQLLRLRRGLQSGQIRRAPGGAVLRLFLEDGSEYAEKGVLQFTDIKVEPSTGSVTVRAIFPNPRKELLPGMYVRFLLEEGTDDAAMLLPQEALLRDPKGNAGVYVVTDQQTVERRPLRVGRTHGADWVVLDGLKAGDRVVVEGLQNIRPGASVRVAAPAAAPAPEGR